MHILCSPLADFPMSAAAALRKDYSFEQKPCFASHRPHATTRFKLEGPPPFVSVWQHGYMAASEMLGHSAWSTRVPVSMLPTTFWVDGQLFQSAIGPFETRTMQALRLLLSSGYVLMQPILLYHTFGIDFLQHSIVQQGS